MSSCSRPLWKTNPYSSRFEGMQKESALSSAYTTPPPSSPESAHGESPLMKTCTMIACVILVSVLVFVIFNSLYSIASGKACGISGKKASLEQPMVIHPENDEQLDAAIQEAPKTLVMFMAPWCGHCNACKQDFADAALLAKDTTFVMADCDSKISEAKVKEHGIRGFPTIMLFKRGKFVKEFDQGARTKDNFTKFCASA